MAKRTEVDCDRCRQQCTDTVFKLDLPVRWQTDPAGGHGDHEYDREDLCHSCLVRTTTILLKRLGLIGERGGKYNYELARDIMKEIMEGKVKG